MITLILGSVLVVPLALAVIFGPLAVAVRSQKLEAGHSTRRSVKTAILQDHRSSIASYRAAVAGG